MNVEDMNDDVDSGEISQLPNFIPPDAPPAPLPKVVIPVVDEYKGVLVESGRIDDIHAADLWVKLRLEDGNETVLSARELGWSSPGDIEAVEGALKNVQAGDNILVKGKGLAAEFASKVEPLSLEVESNSLSAPVENKFAESGVEKAESNFVADEGKPLNELLAEVGELVKGSETKAVAEAATDNNSDAYAALMQTANRVTAGAPVVDPGALSDVNNAINKGASFVPGAGPTQGQQQVKTGVQALAEGAMSLVGGTGAVVGELLKGTGKVLNAAVGGFADKKSSEVDAKAESAMSADGSPTTSADAPTGGVTVLPRLSDYRVDQIEKAASTYEEAHKQFWASGGLPDVRKEIEERARSTGLSVEDVMEKMKPNGEMADLAEKFNNAVKASPDAQSQKKTMDKALEGWGRQHARAQEELVNPEQEGNPHHETLKSRIEAASNKMKQHASNLPLFEGEDKTHLERFREIIAKIAEKLKEFVAGAVNFLRGKKVANQEAESAPTP